MTKLVVPRNLAEPIVKDRRARNGRYPHHIDATGIGQRLNWYACHGGRKVHQDAGTPVQYTAATDDDTRRGMFHSSPSPGELYLIAEVLVPVNQAVRLQVFDGTTTTSTPYQYQVSQQTTTSTVSFDDLARLRFEIAIDGDTEYEWYVDQFQALLGATPVKIFPPYACLVYEWSPPEVDVGVGGGDDVVDTRAFYSRGPIYDADTQSLVESIHNRWKAGPQLVSISAFGESDNYLTFSSTYVNILDKSVSPTSTVSASSPGFNLPLTYLNPYHTTDVRAVFAVYAKQDGGGAVNNDVKLVDSSGDLATLSDFSDTAYEWKTAAVTLTGGATQKVDVHARADGAPAIRCRSICLWIKES